MERRSDAPLPCESENPLSIFQEPNPLHNIIFQPTFQVPKISREASQRRQVSRRYGRRPITTRRTRRGSKCAHRAPKLLLSSQHELHSRKWLCQSLMLVLMPCLWQGTRVSQDASNNNLKTCTSKASMRPSTSHATTHPTSMRYARACPLGRRPEEGRMARLLNLPQRDGNSARNSHPATTLAKLHPPTSEDNYVHMRIIAITTNNKHAIVTTHDVK